MKKLAFWVGAQWFGGVRRGEVMGTEKARGYTLWSESAP